jgi:hypothetical protein
MNAISGKTCSVVFAVVALALSSLAGAARAAWVAEGLEEARSMDDSEAAAPAKMDLQSATSPASSAEDSSKPPQEASVEKAAPKEEPGGSSRLSEEPIPLEKLPERPAPPIELGQHLLGTGTLPQGIKMPGGAVWQPAFFAWGILRTGIHDVEVANDVHRAAWLNRADLFGQLNLTPTERVIVSFRPFDENGQFVGVNFSPVRRTQNDFNRVVRTLYFEGDFGEMFPDLDPADRHALDYGIAAGRMPLFFQEGMLINDPLDAVGVVRNSLRVGSASNLRLTGVFCYGDVNRGGNQVLDTSAKLYGLFSEFDVPTSTVDIDFAYVDASKTTGRGFYGGVSSVQRLWGSLNTTFRVLGSYPLDQVTTSVGKGFLIYSAMSWTPRSTDNIVYLNTFGAINFYTPAARDAGLGGPLTNVGILYESVGFGTGYGNVLPNIAKDSYGGAIGFQQFFNRTRTQIIYELGARKGTATLDNKLEGALAIRFQQAIGRRLIARLEGFAHVKETVKPQYGVRYELLLKL